LGIARLGEGGQAIQEATHPPNVMFANSEKDIIDLHCQETAFLAQALNRPPRRCGAEPAVPCINVGAVLNEGFRDLSVAVQGSVVQDGCAFVVQLSGGGCIGCQHFTHSCCTARRDS
jgi:hypothetical protein